MRVGAGRCVGATLPGVPCAAAHSIERAQQAIELEVGQLADVAKRPRELRLAVSDPGQPSHDAYAKRRERIEVDVAPIRMARQLEGGKVACAREVLDRVVALVVESRDIHPPLEVATSVGPQPAHVLADGESDVASRSLDVVGDLRAGGRGTDHEHAAGIEVAWACVPWRRQLGNVPAAQTRPPSAPARR